MRALERGHHAQAEAAFTALAADPARSPAERAYALNKRGVARAGAGRGAAAREDFEAALALDPRCTGAMVNLGNQRLEAGEIEAAVEHYRRAIGLDEDYAVAHLNLGIALKRLGRVDEGVREMRRAQRLEGRAFGKPTKRG